MCKGGGARLEVRESNPMLSPAVFEGVGRAEVRGKNLLSSRFGGLLVLRWEGKRSRCQLSCPRVLLVLNRGETIIMLHMSSGGKRPYCSCLSEGKRSCCCSCLN